MSDMNFGVSNEMIIQGQYQLKSGHLLILYQSQNPSSTNTEKKTQIEQASEFSSMWKKKGISIWVYQFKLSGQDAKSCKRKEGDAGSGLRNAWWSWRLVEVASSKEGGTKTGQNTDSRALTREAVHGLCEGSWWAREWSWRKEEVVNKGYIGSVQGRREREHKGARLREIGQSGECEKRDSKGK
jgi:hypothetical protein